MRILRILTIAVFAWIAVAGLAAKGQINPYPPPGQGAGGRNPNGIPQQQSTEPTDLPPRIAAEQARAGNADRQKQLAADTARLLSLATELKQEVDKTNQNVMSLDVIKKADEIEKLAKSVKERMKGAR